MLFTLVVCCNHVFHFNPSLQTYFKKNIKTIIGN